MIRALATAVLAASLWLSVATLAPRVAAADTPVAAQASETPRDLSRYKEEPVPGGALLVVAYGVMWTLLAGFVARLLWQQSRLEAELRSLQDRLDATSGGRSGGAPRSGEAP